MALPKRRSHTALHAPWGTRRSGGLCWGLAEGSAVIRGFKPYLPHTGSCRTLPLFVGAVFAWANLRRVGHSPPMLFMNWGEV